MPTEPSYVHHEIKDMPRESSDVYQELKDIIASKTHGIPVSCLELRYEQKFKRSLDYNSLGVKTIKELLFKMCDQDMVLLYKDSKSNEYVTWAHWVGDQIPPRFSEYIYKGSSEIEDMPMESSDVYREIQDVLASFFCGFRMSCLSWLEKRYERKFSRSLDYESLGVKNIQELICKMVKEGSVLLSVEPESNISYVMSASLGEYMQKVLKRNVQKLLNKHDGEIPLSSFEVMYKDEFKVTFKYHHYGLNDFDHLCRVLNLVVEGKKVIKAAKDYNLRKKTKWMKR